MKYITILALLLASFSNTLWAEIKPEDQIKYRQSGYTFMRWNMGIIKNQVVENPQSYNKDKTIAASDVIAAIANSGLGALFSDNTASGKGWKATRVKREFFQQPEEVKDLAIKFKKEANELARVSHSGDVDTIKGQFKNLLKACKACHKKFRAKE